MMISPASSSGDELVDHRVNGRAGLDHDLRFARPRKGLRQIPRESWSLRCSCPWLAPAANFSVTAVVRLKTATRKPLTFHVENEVFAHDGEADQSDVALIHEFLEDVPASLATREEPRQPTTCK